MARYRRMLSPSHRIAHPPRDMTPNLGPAQQELYVDAQYEDIYRSHAPRTERTFFRDV